MGAIAPTKAFQVPAKAERACGEAAFCSSQALSCLYCDDKNCHQQDPLSKLVIRIQCEQKAAKECVVFSQVWNQEQWREDCLQFPFLRMRSVMTVACGEKSVHYWGARTGTWQSFSYLSIFK